MFAAVRIWIAGTLEWWTVRQLLTRRAGARGGWRVVRLAVVALATAAVATGCSWSDMPRLGWPSAITSQGERMLHLWTATWFVAFAVGALVWGLTFWTVTFHRKKSEELPRQTKYNALIEGVCVGVPIVMVAVLFYFTAITESFVTKESPHPNVSITVTAFKWGWEFDYEGTKEPETGQMLHTTGTSSTIPILVLPAGESVRVHEVSRDVIHSFWVPSLLFKRDVIPGRVNSFQFDLNSHSEGAYVGHCAELCGTYHAMMNFEMRVVTPKQYRGYLAALAKYKPSGATYNNRQALALTSIGENPYATTTHPFDTNRTVRHAS